MKSDVQQLFDKYAEPLLKLLAPLGREDAIDLANFFIAHQLEELSYREEYLTLLNEQTRGYWNRMKNLNN